MKIIEKNIRTIDKSELGKILLNVLVNTKRPKNENPCKKGFDNLALYDSLVLSQINFNRHMNLIIFGIGSLDLIQNITKKISKYSTFTIVENDIEYLKKLLNIKNLEWIFSDARVSVISGTDDEIISTLGIKISTVPFLINAARTIWLSSPYSKSYDQQSIDKIKYYAMNHIKYMVTNIGNDINDVLSGMKYTFENSTTMKEGLFLNEFKNLYKDVPAIIVAGGPSLDKNIHLLSEAKGKALILSVDTTYKKILNQGIIPDSISSIERYDIVYDAFFSDGLVPKQSVFIGPPVVVKKVFDLFERKIISGRTGEIYVRDIIKEVGGENIDIGTSCTHVAYAFAKYVGANPIIFIGQDLAFSKDGTTHTKDASEITIKGAKKARKTTVIGNDGNLYETTFVYKQFLLWYEKDILNSPSTLFINATEGGAKIKGTVVMPFSSVLEKYCTKEIDPLYKYYDALIESRIPSNKIDESFLSYLDNLKVATNKALNKIDKILSKFKEISEDYSDENMKKILSVKDDLLEIYKGSEKLFFIFQSVYLMNQRKINEYPVNLTEKEYREVNYLLNRIGNQYKDVFEGLMVKFEELGKEL